MAKALPLSTMEFLLKKAGARRVAEDAKSELKKILENKSTDLSKKASLFADHAGRKTVRKEDIEMATQS